jgi:hypothetical protein
MTHLLLHGRRAPFGRQWIWVGLLFALVGTAIAIWLNGPPTRFAPPPTRIVGNIRTRLPGVSVAGLPVRVVLLGRPASGETDTLLAHTKSEESGRFTLTFDAAIGDRALVLVSVPASSGSCTYHPSELALGPGRTIEGLEIELIEGVAVEGYVVDDADRPVSGVRVGAFVPEPMGLVGPVVPPCWADDRGRFSFRLAPGTYSFVVSQFAHHPGYARTYPGGFSMTLEIPSDASTFTPAPFRLQEKTVD